MRARATDGRPPTRLTPLLAGTRPPDSGFCGRPGRVASRRWGPREGMATGGAADDQRYWSDGVHREDQDFRSRSIDRGRRWAWALVASAGVGSADPGNDDIFSCRRRSAGAEHCGPPGQVRAGTGADSTALRPALGRLRTGRPAGVLAAARSERLSPGCPLPPGPLLVVRTQAPTRLGCALKQRRVHRRVDAGSQPTLASAKGRTSAAPAARADAGRHRQRPAGVGHIVDQQHGVTVEARGGGIQAPCSAATR